MTGKGGRMHDEPTVTVRIELFDDEPETAEETRRD